MMLRHRRQWRRSHVILCALIATDLLRVPMLVRKLFRDFFTNVLKDDSLLAFPLSRPWCFFNNFFSFALCPLAHSLILLLSVDKIIALYAPFKHRIMPKKVYPLCILSMALFHTIMAILAVIPLDVTSTTINVETSGADNVVEVCLSIANHPLKFLTMKGSSVYYDGMVHVIIVLFLDIIVLVKTSRIIIEQKKMAKLEVKGGTEELAATPQNASHNRRVRPVLRLVAMQSVYIFCRSGSILEWVVTSENMKSLTTTPNADILVYLQAYAKHFYGTYLVFYHFQFLPDILLFVFILWDCRFIREGFFFNRSKKSVDKRKANK